MREKKSGVDYINSFSKSGKKVENLDRIKSLMKSVGNPEKNLKIIHVAGTNGKGSMCQMFNEILIEAGYKTGLFTSPYIVEYSDRIKINNKNISYEDIDKLVEKIRPIIESDFLRESFSQFEVTQALAFLYFAQQKCDVVVLETGLGGVLDSTNIIEKPIVSVIGSISFDHTAILGETLKEIANQKAGIIKHNCPVVVSPKNSSEVFDVMRVKSMETCSSYNVPKLDLCVVKSCDIYGSRFSYMGEDYHISMSGEHQISNALTVIEGMKFISKELSVSKNDIKIGLEKAQLFGRTEILSESPLTILDGSHNPDGVEALAVLLKNAKSPITAIIGMHKDKNALDAVENLVPIVDKFIAVDGFSPLEYERNELGEIIKTAGGNCEINQKDIKTNILDERKSNSTGTIVICGSLYMVSFVKNNVDNEDFV